MLKQPGQWNIPFWGDILINAVNYGSKKIWLIFHTWVQGAPLPSEPVQVLDPRQWEGGTVDSDIIVCLAFNGSHYESLHPVSQADIELTKQLVQSYRDRTYGNEQWDIKYLISNAEKRCQSPWPTVPVRYLDYQASVRRVSIGCPNWLTATRAQK